MFDELLLKELTDCYGPSGREHRIRKLIRDKVEGFVDEIREDKLGNLICLKKGKSGKKLAFSAHMDELGLMVTHIDKNGFLSFSTLGGVPVNTVMHKRVEFENGTPGTIIVGGGIKDMGSVQHTDMYIDIGCSTKEEALQKVKPGDVAVYSSPFVMYGNRAASKAMDDRAGCYALIKVIKEMKEWNDDVYFVFTVQEEVGIRGATVAAYDIFPDIFVAVDVTGEGDFPGNGKNTVFFENGPAIKAKDGRIIAHPTVFSMLVNAMEAENIPYQVAVAHGGGTDAGAFHMTRSGVPSGVLSIPCRYVHQGCELIDPPLMENYVKALISLIKIGI